MVKPATRTGRPKPSPAQGMSPADVDRIDARIAKILDLIAQRVWQVASAYQARPMGLPPAETVLTAPVPLPATSFQSRVLGQLNASTQAAAAEQQRVATRESPREQRLRGQEL